MLKRCLALFLLLPGLSWAGGYVSVYEDLPLPPALTEVAGSAFSFESQDGRIVEAEARGHSDRAGVLQFYGSALPQLGWVQDSPTQFHRDQDILRLELTEPDKHSISIHFKIAPK